MRRAALILGVMLVASTTVGCAAGADQSLDALDTAQGVAGQTLLTQAAPTASAYFTTNGSYTGFSAATAKAEEPSINWVDGGTPKPNSVTITGVTPTSVVLLTAETAGEMWCIGQTGGVNSMGSTAATSALECAGGW